MPVPPLDAIPHVRRSRPPRPYAAWFTPQFDRYIRPAQAFPSIWRTMMAVLVGGLIYVFGALLVIYGVGRFVLDTPSTGGLRVQLDAVQDTLLPMLMRGNTPVAMGTMLATFIPLGLAVWVMARLHRRGLRSLLGPRVGFARNFIYAFIAVALFHVPLVVSGLITGLPGHVASIPPSVWALNLVWALPLIFIQTTSEELVFRGYLQQQLAVRARHPLVWMLLPSLIFGLGHGDPDGSLQTQTEYVVWATLFGLIAADLTRVTGSLAAAMGMHFANNTFVMLWVGTENAFGGLALYRLPFEAIGPAPPFWTELLILALIWVLARRLLRPRRARG